MAHVARQPPRRPQRLFEPGARELWIGVALALLGEALGLRMWPTFPLPLAAMLAVALALPGLAVAGAGLRHLLARSTV